MIDPRDMTDHQLIAELQGWLPALAEIKKADWGQMGTRYRAVYREFEGRMASGRSVLYERTLVNTNTTNLANVAKAATSSSPRFGTKEEIEEERSRAVQVADRVAKRNASALSALAEQ